MSELETSMRQISTSLKMRKIVEGREIEWLNDVVSHSEIVMSTIITILKKNDQIRDKDNFMIENEIFHLPTDVITAVDRKEVEDNKAVVMNMLQSLSDFTVHELQKLLEYYRSKRKETSEDEMPETIINAEEPEEADATPEQLEKLMVEAKQNLKKIEEQKQIV